MKKRNNLAVILLNYNDADTVIKYASVIEKYSHIDKIIIVDNNSIDDSYTRLKKLSSNKIDVIKCPKNCGYAAGNNYGIKYLIKNYGSFKYITISNSDVVVSETTFKECTTFLDENKNVAVCVPRMYDKNNHLSYYSVWKSRSLIYDLLILSKTLSFIFSKSEFYYYSSDYLDYNDHVYVDCVGGSFFVINSDVFKQVNYFDENTFLYYEEDILCNKIKNLGYKCVMLNTCNYTHFESTTINKNLNDKEKKKILFNSMRYYHLNYDDACNKWYNRWKIILFDIIRLLNPFDKLFFYFFKGLNLIFNLITYLWKLFILLIHVPLFPFIYFYKLTRKNKRVLYLSKIPYDFNHDSIIKKYINNTNYKVKNIYYYEYKDSLEKANEYISKHKIINYKMKHYNFTNRLRWYIMFINSFWIYDEIIINSIDVNYYFFMLIHRMRKTKIHFEKKHLKSKNH